MQKTLVLTIGLFLSISTWAQEFRPDVVSTLRASVMVEAAWAMKQKPVTVTASHSDRSAGGRHDFFSEADYFWPNPASPDSPYINKDGQSNPNNFVAHRLAMIRLSKLVGALGSAWVLTHDDRHVRQALDHCRAWFVDTTTMMNPNLEYGQAIKGRVAGRSYGIIDTIQLMEVVMGLEAMEGSKAMDAALLEKIKAWFAHYLHWLTTHPYGVTEMNALNNHSTCWAMQVAAFARFTGDHMLMDFCKTRYKTVLLPRQMAPDGSFPLEIRRTKPYGYSLFNLDAMATICQLLSTPGDDLWHYQADSGQSIQKGIEYLYPYIADKNRWPYPHDIMIWDQWPVAQPALLFGAVAYGNKEWLETWKRLDHDPQNPEVIRNLPVRHPLIWLTGAGHRHGVDSGLPDSPPVDVAKVIADAERQTEVMLDSVKAIREADGAPGGMGVGDGKTPFSPRTIENGRLKLVSSRDWTSGYFPGVLWMLYKYTGKPEWKREARLFTAPEQRESVNGTSHDVGLKVFSSFGAGYRITRDTAYRSIIVTAARTLATRFNPRIGVIRSWDHHRELWQYPVIIDNMMNLELLFEATHITGDSSFYRIAVSHANTTMKNHFRANYSSYHVVDYDTVTGQVRRRMTWQGYADSSAWARGQAWGLYGYTVCYRYTHDPAYLRQAEHIAAFILHHPRLPADMVPYWDFDAPGIPRDAGGRLAAGKAGGAEEPRDASAAAVIASGLYELSGYSANSEAYRKAADQIVKSLTDHYRAPVGEDKGFILLHSTGTKPTNLEVDEPLSYADYYYMEALLRSTWVPGM
jgi:unsaturated chondroitin disaccharide hydrolase